MFEESFELLYTINQFLIASMADHEASSDDLIHLELSVRAKHYKLSLS